MYIKRFTNKVKCIIILKFGAILYLSLPKKGVINSFMTEIPIL